MFKYIGVLLTEVFTVGFKYYLLQMEVFLFLLTPTLSIIWIVFMQEEILQS